jgi:glucokinase
MTATSPPTETLDEPNRTAGSNNRTYVAVDLGGTQLRVGLFDAQATLIARWAVPTPTTGTSDVVDEIAHQVRTALDRAAAPVHGVGISSLGPVDHATGYIHTAPTLPGFTAVPLTELLQARLSIPASVINDANAAALAEWRLGAGQGTEHFCFVTVSTGIGCGLVINGRPLIGRNGTAGELGRILIPGPDGTATRLEDLASGSAIARAARDAVVTDSAPGLAELAGNQPLTARVVADAAAHGEPTALAILTAAATVLGTALANLVRLISPDVIAIGGGVSQSGLVYWTPLRHAFEDSVRLDFAHLPPLVPTRLADDAGLYGAALILFDERRP